MAVLKCMQRKINKFSSDEFIATFCEIQPISVQNVHHGSQCTAYLVPNKTLLPAESFLTNKLPLLMENVPLETRHTILNSSV
jgi:hypothetical protein